MYHSSHKPENGWRLAPTLYKTHFVFHRPDLRKIGDDCSIKIGRQPTPASKTKYLPSEPPVSASRITSASGKGNSAALPRRNSRRHGKLPDLNRFTTGSPTRFRWRIGLSAVAAQRSFTPRDQPALFRLRGKPCRGSFTRPSVDLGELVETSTFSQPP